MIDYIEHIGLLAGFCTTIAFLPQLIKALKTREVKDISTLMYLIFITGVILWIIYGLYHNSYPLVIANVITLLFALSILLIKILCDKPKSLKVKYLRQ